MITYRKNKHTEKSNGHEKGQGKKNGKGKSSCKQNLGYFVTVAGIIMYYYIQGRENVRRKIRERS